MSHLALALPDERCVKRPPSEWLPFDSPTYWVLGFAIITQYVSIVHQGCALEYKARAAWAILPVSRFERGISAIGIDIFCYMGVVRNPHTSSTFEVAILGSAQ